MIKNLLSALFIGAALFSFGQASNYSNGSTVTNFTVTDTDGNTHDLYTITASGKHVMLDFFFDTCGPCQARQTYFNEAYDKYGCNDGDLYFISINNGTDNDAEVEAYEQTYGGPFHHAPAVSADGGGGPVTADFGISATPTFVLIGPDNKMIANDIWPMNGVAELEGAFPSGFNPIEMDCSFASLPTDNHVLSALSVFPNPTANELNISFDATVSATANIEIMNLLGQVVYTNSFETTVGTNQNIIDVNDLSEGQYVARIIMNEQATTVKFVKK